MWMLPLVTTGVVSLVALEHDPKYITTEKTFFFFFPPLELPGNGRHVV